MGAREFSRFVDSDASVAPVVWSYNFAISGEYGSVSEGYLRRCLALWTALIGLRLGWRRAVEPGRIKINQLDALYLARMLRDAEGELTHTLMGSLAHDIKDSVGATGFGAHRRTWARGQ